jgi:hypothetical protein
MSTTRSLACNRPSEELSKEFNLSISTEGFSPM